MNSELDAQVAREVMRWTVLIEPKHPVDLPEGIDPTKLAFLDSVSRRLGLQRYVSAGPSSAMWYFREWHPSSDIVAAFEVIVHMQTKGWRYEVGATADGGHCAMFMRGDYDIHNDTWDEDWYGIGDTPAEAICRAALDAVRVGKEQTV